MSQHSDTTNRLSADKPSELVLYSVFLMTGSWKKLIGEQQAKTMIAEALNYCRHKHHLKTAGYMISKRKLCLVLENEWQTIHRQLVLLNEALRDILKREFERFHSGHKHIQPHEFEEQELLKPVLMPETFINACIVKLITGRQVILPYSDAHLNRVKKSIHDSDFCSALDYSGAKGPVVITHLHPKKDQRIRDVILEKP